jgi:hypothetical protein
MSIHRLTHDELLRYPGFHGTQSLCHLRVYQAAGEAPICIVGNFDEGAGTSTTNAIEVVATRAAEEIRTGEFRLFEWYPHSSASPFSEVELSRVAASPRQHGQVLVQDAPPHFSLAANHATVTRFERPHWLHRSEADVAQLLGDEVVHELRALAGARGEYTAERLFGPLGGRHVDEIREHNQLQQVGLEGLLTEWSLER